MSIYVIQRTGKESGKAYVFFDSVKLFSPAITIRDDNSIV